MNEAEESHIEFAHTRNPAAFDKGRPMTPIEQAASNCLRELKENGAMLHPLSRTDAGKIITRHLTTLTKPLEDKLAQTEFECQECIKRIDSLEDENERLREALENLIFTATKLWDQVKSIKDGPCLRVAHPIIEQAREVLAKSA